MVVSILIFLLVLSILVLVHEFGHFIVAKRAGIPVLEFALGLPLIPKIFGIRIGETMYSVYPVLFGGFVRLLGENELENAQDLIPSVSVKNADRLNKSQFINKPKRVRAAIVSAGVIMNFILSIVAFGIVYSFTGIPRDTHQLKIVDVTSGSPAETAGLIVGDIVTKVGKDSIANADDFISKVNLQKGKITQFTIQRDSVVKTLSVTPRQNPPEGQGPLGVVVTTTEIYFPPVWQRPFYGVYYGFREAIFWGQTIVLGLATMIAQAFKGQVPQGVSGPVGIFAVTTEAARNGLMTLINFVGVLSVNLAILNILPLPALDGGRLLFIGIEAVTRRKISPKIESVVHSIGMVVLLALLLAITVGDVRHLIMAGGVDGFIKSVVK